MDGARVTPIRYDAFVPLIAARAAACGTTKVIAIDGPSGAGKTDFAAGLSELLGAPVLHLEDVYPGWSGLARTPGLIAEGVLGRLAVDGIGSVARWDWDHDRPADLIRVRPAPLLILEGVGSGARACRPFLSLLVWLEAPADVRKRRALSRDGETYAPHWDRWAAQERDLFTADGIRAAADVVVDTSPGGILDPTRSD